MEDIQIQDFKIVRGDTWKRELEFYSDSGETNITGWTIFLTAKEKISDADSSAKISKTITVHTEPLNGKTQITLSSAETNLPIGSYVYDIQFKTATGDVTTILTGTITILSDVTQRTS